MASSSVNYEVMVLQGGRWELHGSYPQDQQGQAIKDAKALENISTIKSVKVVREEVVSASGETRENNIYASSNLADEQPQGAKDARLSRQTAPAANKSPDKKSKSRSKPAKSAKNGNMQAGARIPQSIEDYDPDAADKITFSFFRLVVRLLMVVLFSAIIAFVVSGLAGIWLGETSLPASTQATILNGLFFGSFLLSVAWMSFSFLSKARMEASRRAQKAPKPPPPPKPENVPATVKSPNRVDFGKETARMAEETKIAEEATKAVQEAFEADQEDDLSAHVAAPDKPVAVTEAKPVEGLEDIGPAKEEAPWLKKQKTYVMDYLAGALNSANMDRAAMDNFNKFGVNLFIAGAIESLGQSRNMDGNTSSRVLCEAVKSMGFKTRDAEAFPDKIQ
ncbi:MAG TPA: hypothetical protein ENI69_10440, partial [Rhodospirillales bacterium]|nr:hypothetical protein [Rhodospirillales bacterium]